MYTIANTVVTSYWLERTIYGPGIKCSVEDGMHGKMKDTLKGHAQDDSRGHRARNNSAAVSYQ